MEIERPSIQYNHDIVDEKYRDANGNIVCFIREDGSIEYNKGIDGFSMRINGKDNTIVIYEQTECSNNKIVVKGENKTIIINRSRYTIKGMNIESRGKNHTLWIGKDLCVFGLTIKHMFEDIFIGDRCLIAKGTSIWCSDHHAILDSNGICINHDKPVTLCDHVWCGFGTTILKGSYVAKDSVIAARSLINNVFPESNVIIAGVPGKIVKTNINWDIKSPIFFD